METNEKILAIQILLEDNRWSFWIDSRSEKALELSKELKEEWWEYADTFIGSIEWFREWDDEWDWRYFRCHYTGGWYEDMDELHWFVTVWEEFKHHTISDKSKEFQDLMISLLNYPDSSFDEDDFNKFLESDELNKLRVEKNSAEQSLKVTQHIMAQMWK